MKLTQSRLFKFLICPALFLLCLFLLSGSFRLMGFVLLIVLAVSYVHFLRSSRTGLMRLVFVSFLIAIFLPIDITLQNYPGPPRFVPLVMGLPTQETYERAQRGELILGGCIVHGNEPRWLWVW